MARTSDQLTGQSIVRLIGTRLPALLLLLAVTSLALAACAPTARPGSPQEGETPYVPISQPAGETPSPSPADPAAEAAANRPTPTITCQDGLTFLNDLTIPDGTVVGPDSTLDKRWEVENSGTCNWNENYRLRLIAGPEMNAQKEQALYPARSGSRAAIRIQFKAPTEPGAYQSAWQAFNAQGEAFGDPFFIDIVVGE